MGCRPASVEICIFLLLMRPVDSSLVSQSHRLCTIVCFAYPGLLRRSTMFELQASGVISSKWSRGDPQVWQPFFVHAATNAGDHLGSVSVKARQSWGRQPPSAAFIRQTIHSLVQGSAVFAGNSSGAHVSRRCMPRL